MNRHPQSGAFLIEVMVATLLLSLGVLPLVAMMTFSVQMPKLAGYRATAVNLASNYVERMRANPANPANPDRLFPYSEKPSSYDGTQSDISAPPLSLCDYPTCDTYTMVIRDVYEMQVAARRELPAGGIVVSCDLGGCSNGIGNLWIMWQEPDTFAALNPSSSDNCPTGVASTAPNPRCLYVRFKL
ncbi:type IV pilus modification protein PilV [Marinobacter sp. M3C]|jgi:type IV pilus assembly protein PilV|uniref:type IV pilus modification protein PilV n=1 Tax=unclassified Marinobacter TaxID=83889 RepID=UPI00201034A1|nr:MULTISPECIES: type IV pilus modification protein PilV [unclassified Marinobacter]MCL1484480.1 type IV pilus modification protein PilV [Marinobacter sp.]UQG54949.1 type IV pilus modification protein PilV [Marinobacter sp. M4C]UQG59677.1 type IV pilus modification protein PilV [Marinobacter sp. M3C]UQG63750.1 type IV pilus modification protein PilV [Marinobacter sp. M2C]UQG68033.1 type IV pilus modification protein PilV [Marinobacter sp. M1C]